MLKLTDRLQMIADGITIEESAADIGTDHGYLPIYLYELNACRHVIMADISEGSLNKAKENAAAAYPDAEFDFRLGSGIEVLSPGEVDTVVIAGMGGLLISDILTADCAKAHSFKKFILEPRNNVGIMRYRLLENGFKIVNEQLVREGRFICEIVTAVPGEQAMTASNSESDIEFEFPYSLITFKNELTEEYIKRHLDIEKKILDGMMMGKEQEHGAIEHQRYRIEYLERLLHESMDVSASSAGADDR